VSDWDDERATAILRCCRDAMGAAARCWSSRASTRSASTGRSRRGRRQRRHARVPGGRQRSAEEFGLLAAAGFRLGRIVPTGRVGIVEGRPA
jgi:hypothetical protein